MKNKLKIVFLLVTVAACEAKKDSREPIFPALETPTIELLSVKDITHSGNGIDFVDVTFNNTLDSAICVFEIATKGQRSRDISADIITPSGAKFIKEPLQGYLLKEDSKILKLEAREIRHWKLNYEGIFDQYQLFGQGNWFRPLLVAVDCKNGFEKGTYVLLTSPPVELDKF